MQKWEYKHILVESNTEYKEEGGGLMARFYYYGRTAGGDWKDNEIAQLGREGWELVGVVPLIGGRVRDSGNASWGTSYTIGAQLFFKRPMS